MKRCLFSATYDFMPDVQKKYQAFIPTRFKEIWYPKELMVDPSVVAWVVNPSQHFIVDRKVLNFFPNLSIIATPSTGRNHIDLKACKKNDVSVHSLLDDRTALETISASAEFTFLHILNSLRRLDKAIIETSKRRWRQREKDMRGNELMGKTVGLVGLGRIGRRLFRYCQAFGARVIYFDPYVKDRAKQSVSLEDVFVRSDIVCVCCALTPETNGMIHFKLLNRLKKEACFINTSRGEVVVENDLSRLIQRRTDVRVSLDVICGEVSGRHLNSPLLEWHDRGRIVVTPHVSGATIESQKKAALITLHLLKEHFKRSSL